MNSDPNLFWIIFSAVFSAIVMAGVFFWGAITYTRMEREGTQHTKRGNGVFLALMMPLVVCFFAMLIAFDRTAWLDQFLK